MSIRDYPDKQRIYLDLDGVIADFARAMKEHNLAAKDAKIIPGWYSNLQPMEGAIAGVNKLLDANQAVFILSKIPSENPGAASEKLLWVNRYLPRIGDHVIISPDKGCVGALRDTLVDDMPEWANAHKFPGRIIRFGVSWDDRFDAALDWPALTNKLLRGIGL